MKENKEKLEKENYNSNLKKEIAEKVKMMGDFYLTDETKSYEYRINLLDRVVDVVKENEENIMKALSDDLNKSKTEAFMTEISLFYEEAKYSRKNLKKWMKRKKVNGTFGTFPSKSYIYNEPYGSVLILSPWNYPIYLTLVPLIGSIISGNTTIVKMSASSVNTSSLLKEIFEKNFKSHEILFLDSKTPHDVVLDQDYDYIFFTGSTRAGKEVMKKASERLIPVSLELGGKSPCIVMDDADLKIAARRIVFGKLINSGQTCIAPDYVLAHKNVKRELIDLMVKEATEMYQKLDGNYAKIINDHHFERLINLLDGEKFIGGESDKYSRKIKLAILEEASFSSKAMEEEIFGPILPVIEFDDFNEVKNKLKRMPKALASYIFSRDKTLSQDFINEISFGGGCINDVIMHISNHHLPFGGVGNSGIGRYHGKYSFETFSHQKSILQNSTLIDIPLRYPPFNQSKLDLLRKVFKTK